MILSVKIDSKLLEFVSFDGTFQAVRRSLGFLTFLSKVESLIILQLMTIFFGFSGFADYVNNVVNAATSVKKLSEC